jgi:hypothetical protein
MGPEGVSSQVILRKTVPRGLKATRMTTFMPGINPRPTLKTRSSAACKALTYPGPDLPSVDVSVQTLTYPERDLPPVPSRTNPDTLLWALMKASEWDFGWSGF